MTGTCDYCNEVGEVEESFGSYFCIDYAACQRRYAEQHPGTAAAALAINYAERHEAAIAAKETKRNEHKRINQ